MHKWKIWNIHSDWTLQICLDGKNLDIFLATSSIFSNITWNFGDFFSRYTYLKLLQAIFFKKFYYYYFGSFGWSIVIIMQSNNVIYVLVEHLDLGQQYLILNSNKTIF